MGKVYVVPALRGMGSAGVAFATDSEREMVEYVEKRDELFLDVDIMDGSKHLGTVNVRDILIQKHLRERKGKIRKEFKLYFSKDITEFKRLNPNVTITHTQDYYKHDYPDMMVVDVSWYKDRERVVFSADIPYGVDRDDPEVMAPVMAQIHDRISSNNYLTFVQGLSPRKFEHGVRIIFS